MQGTRESLTGVGKIKAGQIDLSGKVALVTGGGRGIGATLSLVLAQAGSGVSFACTRGATINAGKEFFSFDRYARV